MTSLQRYLPVLGVALLAVAACQQPMPSPTPGGQPMPVSASQATPTTTPTPTKAPTASAAATETPAPGPTSVAPAPTSVAPAPMLSPTFDVSEAYDRRTPFVPLDNPALLAASEATYLEGGELVLAMEWGGEVHVYPLRMVTFHHIVNDTIAGRSLLITY